MQMSSMAQNRSMPRATIIPELAYADVREAAEWLCRCFGFVERLRIADHRAQLVFGEGSVIVVGYRGDPGTAPAGHSIMVRAADVDSHYEHAKLSGARILAPPTDFPYGERQYSAQDPCGHCWTFSQTIADVDPASWGGVLFEAS
jgi:uncharacterized glyoxalase superfamily protein PhnB